MLFKKLKKRSSQALLFQSLPLKIFITVFVFILIINQNQTNAQFCLQQTYMYNNYATSTCDACLYYCQTCVTSTQCQTCKSQYYQFPQNSGLCQPCGYGCQVCNNNTDCITCQTGLYLNGNGQCLSCEVGVQSCTLAIIQSCQIGYFRLGNICAGCLSNCAQCNDFVTCNTCKQTFYLVPGSGNTPYSCKSCSSNCLICSSSTVCTSCARGYKVNIDNTCIQESCTGFNKFCTKCSSSACTQCQQGYYLNSGSCKQGASLLCLQSVNGKTHIYCETGKYGCPSYAQVQKDSNKVTLDICLPKHYTVYSEYAYQKIKEQSISCSSSTCSQAPSTKTLSKSSHAYYQIKYYLSLRLYNNNIHNIVIKQVNNSADSGTTHSSINITNNFALGDIGCTGCSYGQLIISGSLKTPGHGTTLFEITDSSSNFQIMESVFQFQLCKITNCQSCTTAIDCLKCSSPYYLQLIKCVTQCDPGFYTYVDNSLNIRSCVLTCPTGTYSIQSTYICTTCQSPCKTCTSQTQCLTCVTGFYLEGTQCLTACTTTYLFPNSTTLKCQQCPNPCTTCQLNSSNSSQVQCLTCDVGYLLQADYSCTYLCPVSTFSSFNNQGNSICETCDPSCTDCYLGTSICSGCKNGYLLYDYTTCNQTNVCLPGYFQLNVNTVLSSGVPVIKQNICQSCHYACYQCLNSEKNCLNCRKGSLLLQADSNGAYSTNVCPLLCPSGMYSSKVTNTNTLKCLACIAPCATCQSLTYCLSCNSTTYLSGFICVTICPNNSVYPDDTTRKCLPCNPPCSECSSSVNCLKCTTGYLDTVNSKCTLQCNSTSYISSSFVCTDCPSPCLQCYGASNCTKCQLPLIILEGSCITQANCINQNLVNQVGKYAFYVKDTNSNSLYGSCQSCTFPCQKCQISSILCKICVTGYILVQQLSTCVTQCPSTYFAQNKTISSVTQQVCSICNTNCLQCIKISTNCTKCSSGMYLHTNSSSNLNEYLCLQVCPDGYYGGTQFGNGGKCFICLSPCINCYNSYLCKTCINGKLLYNKNCIDSCPQGTTVDSVTNPTQCISCATGCSICSNSTTNCTACLSGYYYIFSNNSCVQTCPDQNFPNQITQQCEPCIQPCLKCTSVSQCTTCITSYFLETSSFTCLTVCPDGTFSNTTNQQCQSCNLTICKTCQINENQCLTCAINYFYDANQNTCVQTCGATQYPDIYTGTCKACPFPCATCTQVDFCQSCQPNYYLFQNRCYSQCPIGYFANTPTGSNITTCDQCETNCQICTSLTDCQKCITNYYVHNGLCVQACPTGTYQTLQALTNYPICSNCFTNCLQCTSAYTCTLCNQGFNLFNGLCLSTCPILHFQETFSQNNNNYTKCSPCSQYCNQCVNATYCTQCLNTLMYNHQCYTECPAKTYSYNNVQCLDCVSPCQTCISQFSCTTCITGYIYFYQACLTQCPSDVWLYQSQNKCESACDTTIGNNRLDTSLLTGRGNIGTTMYPHNKICYLPGQACGSPRLLVNNNQYCLQNCPINHYVSTSYQCLSCSMNSNICSNLFIGDLKIIRSNALTLMIYFSQKAQLISSIKQIQIQFTSVDNQILSYTIQAYQITHYYVKLVYGFDQISLVTVTVIIPYLKSMESQQCINQNVFVGEISYYRNYQSYIVSQGNANISTATALTPLSRSLQTTTSTQTSLTFTSQTYQSNSAFSYSGQTIVNAIAILSISLMFISLIINVIVLQSHFLQLMDFCQLIALTMYLQIQYPPLLQYLLYNFGIALLNFLPGVSSQQVLKFSQSKFIFYNDDSSITREVLLVILFIIFLAVFLVILIIDYARNNCCLTPQEQQIKLKEKQRSKSKRISTKKNKNNLKLNQIQEDNIDFQHQSTKQIQKNTKIEGLFGGLINSPLGQMKKQNYENQDDIEVIAIGDKNEKNPQKYILDKQSKIKNNNPNQNSQNQDQFYHHKHYDDQQDSQQNQNYQNIVGNTLKSINKKGVNDRPSFQSSPLKVVINTEENQNKKSNKMNNLDENAQIEIKQKNNNELNLSQKQQKQSKATSCCENFMEKLVKRIRYRHLNDLFGLFLSPILLFAFSLPNSGIDQIILSTLLIGSCVIFIGVICYKIINMKKLSDLTGLMSELQPTEHVVGLMYTPFSHIRRFIFCMIIGIQPEKPLSALTLLLVFTILILVCLVFYQPFLNQFTDYIAIGTQIILSVYIIVVMVIGLNVMQTNVTWIFGIVASSIALIGLVIGIAWLIWLTIIAIKQNFCMKKQQLVANQLTDMLLLGNNPVKTRQIAISPNKISAVNQQSDQCSANNLMVGVNIDKSPKRNNKNDVKNNYYEDQYQNSQKQEFQHYGDDSSQKSQVSEDKNRPPQLLIKMTTQL